MSESDDGEVEHSCPLCGSDDDVLERGRAFGRNRTNDVDNEVTVQEWHPKECVNCGCVFATLGSEITEGT